MDFESIKVIIATISASLTLIIAFFIIIYLFVWVAKSFNHEKEYLDSLDDDKLKIIYDYRRHCNVPFFKPFHKKKEKKKE